MIPVAADSYMNLIVAFQYIQDKQEVTLNVRFGAQIRPSSDFSDIQAGMSEIRTKSDHPKFPRDVSNAAFPDIHIFYTYIVMHFFTVPPQSKLHTNSLNPLG